MDLFLVRPVRPLKTRFNWLAHWAAQTYVSAPTFYIDFLDDALAAPSKQLHPFSCVPKGMFVREQRAEG
jgi:hypothetical protein